MTAALITTADIAELIGVSRRHVTDRLTKDPTFPAPTVRLSQKLVRWDRDQVLAWLTAGRRSAPASPGSSATAASASLDAR